jgi:hydroxymethylpyrimidine/phosphomethylpyrimidine kinase
MKIKMFPAALTIAGSDNSGGAGLQADLKTFTTLGVYGASAITCVVAEHPGRVKSIEPLPSRCVREQIELVFESIPISASKTGMLFSAALIRAVAAQLEAVPKKIPLVVDPVMVASSGAVLLRPDAIRALQQLILPRAAVVTPNRDEAALLWGQPIADLKALRQAAIDLTRTYGVPFLVKGGHLGLREAVDLLAMGKTVREYRAKMIPQVNPHGTGCTFSAAITAGLARGLKLEEAVTLGKKFITRAIQRRLRYGPYDILNQMP